LNDLLEIQTEVKHEFTFKSQNCDEVFGQSIAITAHLQKQLQNLSYLVFRELNKIHSSALALCDRLRPVTAKLVARMTEQKSLLAFAMQAMAKLSGAPLVKCPPVDRIIQHPQVLEQYFDQLKAMPSNKIEIGRPAPDIKSALMTMNGLMSAMNEHMQEEHEQLMSVLYEHSISSINY
jgi:hypothetical protein